MPFELGLFLGCKQYGIGQHKKKVALILDTERYRYQQFISDIAGQDIHAHNDDVPTVIGELRKWLATASQRKNLPGGKDISERYDRFRIEFPTLCKASKLQPQEVTFSDLQPMIVAWLRNNR